MRRLLKFGFERRQALIAHQHEETDFRQMLGILRVEPAGTVLDRISSIERQRFACMTHDGVERLRREALNGVPVNGLDGRGSRNGHKVFFRHWQRFGGGIWLA